MRTGILEALRTVRPDAQRQVVVFTDGQIGFEAEVVDAICKKLPPSSRLHMVGVGSAVNRSLTEPAARAGGGVEVVVGLGEDPERAAQTLRRRTAEPLFVDLTIAGSALVDRAPSLLPDLFAGTPTLVSLALRPEGGDLVVRGRTASGVLEQRLSVPPVLAASGCAGVVALFGRRKIEDHELHVAAGGSRLVLDRDIERLGLDFQLATRLTSWIAVTQEVTVNPRAGRRHERMPHELPHGMSAESVGLRPAAGAADEEGVLFSLADLVKAERQASANPSVPFEDILAGSLAGPAPAKGAPAKPKMDLKAKLGRAPARIGAAEPQSIPAPPFAPQSLPVSAPAPLARPSSPVPPSLSAGSSIRIEAPQASLPRRSRSPLGWTPLVFFLALGVAYYFVHSFGLAAAIAAGVFLAAVLIRTFVRLLFR
jgi:Ca-activated chloride channel family protein